MSRCTRYACTTRHDGAGAAAGRWSCREVHAMHGKFDTTPRPMPPRAQPNLSKQLERRTRPLRVSPSRKGRHTHSKPASGRRRGGAHVCDTASGARQPPAARGAALGPHRGVGAAGGEQLGVAPALDDLSAAEHDDLVGGEDRLQPVGDDEHGALAVQRRECVADRRLVVMSSAAVASSSRTIGASFSSARAIETRWRSPPDSARARLADGRRPSRAAAARRSRPRARAARRARARRPTPPGRPIRTLSAIVASNR